MPLKRLAFFDAVIAGMAEGVVVQNRSGDIEICNSSAEAILGLTAEPVEGDARPDPFRNAVRYDGSPFPKSEHPASVTLRTGEPQHDVIMGIEKPDGSLTWISINSEPVRECPDAEPQSVVTTFRDITDSVLAEREILEKNAELTLKDREIQTLLTLIPDIITRAKPDTTITFVNDSYAHVVGVPAEDLIGRRFLDVVVEEERVIVEANIDRLTPDNPISYMEQRMPTRTSGDRWYWWSNMMRFENGEPTEIISVGRDVTALRKARQKIADQARGLHQANSLLRQFAGITSHDLQAPLRHIAMFADMLKSELDPDAGAALEHANSISERVQLMRVMIRSLLHFAEIVNEDDLNLKAFSLQEAVDEAIRIHEPALQELDVKVRVDPLPMVTGDRKLITEVFQNLIDNAIKYRRDDAVEIAVSCGDRTGEVLVSVTDNGMGVEPTHAVHVFEMFRRAHGGNRPDDGVGIGLPLCRRIIEAHGGELWLDTNHQDGSRFSFTLPERQPLS